GLLTRDIRADRVAVGLRRDVASVDHEIRVAWNPGAEADAAPSRGLNAGSDQRPADVAVPDLELNLSAGCEAGAIGREQVPAEKARFRGDVGQTRARRQLEGVMTAVVRPRFAPADDFAVVVDAGRLAQPPQTLLEPPERVVQVDDAAVAEQRGAVVAGSARIEIRGADRGPATIDRERQADAATGERAEILEAEGRGRARPLEHERADDVRVPRDRIA